MEAIVAVALLAVVGLLAVRFGADSRDRLVSNERVLAAHGMTWVELVDGPPLARDLPAAGRDPEAGPTLPHPLGSVDAVLGRPKLARPTVTGAARP